MDGHVVGPLVAYLGQEGFQQFQFKGDAAGVGQRVAVADHVARARGVVGDHPLEIGRWHDDGVGDAAHYLVTVCRLR